MTKRAQASSSMTSLRGGSQFRCKRCTVVLNHMHHIASRQVAWSECEIRNVEERVQNDATSQASMPLF